MPPPDRARRWAALVLAIYLALVVLVSLAPRPLDTGVTPWVRGTLAQMHRAGLPGFISYDVVELAAHVVLFVPLGMLAVVATGRRMTWLATIALIAVCVLVEFEPTLLAPDHSPSMLDLFLNIVGAVSGAAIGYWALTPYMRAPDAAA
jgi:VanZ family protein